MIPLARAVPAAFAILAFHGGGTTLEAQESDVDAVIRVVRAESEAYFRRDSVAFKRTWLQDSNAVIMFAGSGGAAVNIGWDKFGLGIMEEMKNNPAPVAIKLGPSNHRVRIDGALAFTEYDETASFPPDSTVIRNRQHRVLVKRDGEWRILSSGIYQMSSYDASPFAIEGRLNAVGSVLTAAKKNRDAIEVLKLNAQFFPKSPRVYHRLGDAYVTVGETKLAIRNYEKSLAIEPKNDVIKGALAKLRDNKSP
jgi:tetratricopeptide (TPR) repeat protein